MGQVEGSHVENPTPADATGDAAPAYADAPAEPPRRGLRRLRLSAEERRTAMDALMLQPTPPSLRRFSVLMSLSVVVAALGLLQDSTAVVVGAMLIAPLMGPIMGLAALPQTDVSVQWVPSSVLVSVTPTEGIGEPTPPGS